MEEWTLPGDGQPGEPEFINHHTGKSLMLAKTMWQEAYQGLLNYAHSRQGLIMLVAICAVTAVILLRPK